ncbi:MAG: hypothetical protein WA790_15820 [Sulfitobacter sp.]
MSDDEIEKARKKGMEEGKLKSDIENHGLRLSRLEKGVISLVGAIVAAWAKSRGLW